MGFTHYPKLEANVIFAWVWPRPPDKANFLTHPRFDTINRMEEVLPPGKNVVGYHSAQNFTKFMGSVASDQKLEVVFSFSNDEVAEDGHWVTDETMPALHYDAESLRIAYDPSKQSATGKFVVTILGRWLKVEVKNVGETPLEFLRCYVRGSVF